MSRSAAESGASGPGRVVEKPVTPLIKEVHVSQATPISKNGSTDYATVDDFRRIFSEKMKDLYLLALLLTADARKAEQCFVAGIEDSVKGNRVFREWAYSWAQRTVIQQAIRMTKPTRAGLTIPDPEPLRVEIDPRLKEIVKLNPLERFAFVMSVLEGYSCQDCSLLLGCSRQAVANAADRAIEHLANGGEIVALHGEQRQGAYTTVSH
jgi:DNA-directed RNA polymerase specialized sigma24 family protein